VAPRHYPSGRQGGFTLLEMLVVVVVLGLLMVGLTQGVRAGLALWTAQQRRGAETAELDASARILRALLTGLAVPASNGSGGGDSGLKGESGRLSFVGELPTGLGTTRRADISIELHGRRLLLIWTLHRHEILLGPPPAPVQTELMSGVDHVAFSYWGASAPDQPPAWQTKWDGAEAPALIRIRIGFVKDDRRRWPDLIIADQL
jgi:general secretion pathway protein J